MRIEFCGVKFRRNLGETRTQYVFVMAFYLELSSFIHCECLIVYGILNFRIALGICCWINSIKSDNDKMFTHSVQCR